MNVETPEQRFVAFEEFLEGVDEQALPEAAGTRQEVVPALIDKTPDVGCLVDVVVPPSRIVRKV